MKINRNSPWIEGQDLEWRMAVTVFTCEETSTATKHSWMTWRLSVIYRRHSAQHAICHGRMFNHTVFPLDSAPRRCPSRRIYIVPVTFMASTCMRAVYDHCVLEKQVAQLLHVHVLKETCETSCCWAKCWRVN